MPNGQGTVNILYLVAKQSLVYNSERCGYLYLFSEWVRLGADTVWCSQPQSKTVRVGELNLQAKLPSSAQGRG